MNWNGNAYNIKESYWYGTSNAMLQINYNALMLIDFLCIEPAEIAFNEHIIAVWRIKAKS